MTGTSPTRWSRWTPASHDGRFGRYAAFSGNGNVRMADMYAPRAMKPIWPSENTPVKPLVRFSETVRIEKIARLMASPCQNA